MSLINKFKYDSAIFDIPKNHAGQKKFRIRRLISLAGRPVFTEKNSPVQITQSPLNLKCFANKQIFKQKKSLNKKSPTAFSYHIKPTSKNCFLSNNQFSRNSSLSIARYLPIEPGKFIEPIFAKQVYSTNCCLNEKKPEIYTDIFLSCLFIFPKHGFEIFCAAPPFSIIRFTSNKISFSNGYFNSSNSKDNLKIDFDYFTSALTSKVTATSEHAGFKLFHLNNPDFRLDYSNNCASPGGNISVNLSPRIFSQRFSPSFFTALQLPSDYEQRFTLGKNLVLTVSQQLKAKEGRFNNLQIIAPAFSSDKTINKKLPVLFDKTQKINLSPASLKSPKFMAIKKMPDTRVLINRILQINKLPQQLQGMHTTSSKISERPDKFRLKLRLKRATSTGANQLFECLIPKKLETSKIFSTILKIQYSKHLFISKFKNLLSATEYDAHKLLPAVACFKSRKLLTHFVTKTHANYVFKLMKQIKCFSLPEKALAWFNSSLPPRESDRFRSKLAGIHKTGIFNDFIGIISRPMPMIMYLHHLNFTDIELPHQKRKLDRFLGIHSLGSINKRTSENHILVNNYIHADQIINTNEFRTKNLRIVKIKFIRNSLQVAKPALKSLNIGNQLTSRLNKTNRIQVGQHTTKFDVLAFVNRIPNEIQRNFPLIEHIILPKPVKKIQSFDIIIPSFWKKIEKFYQCKLRLLPYPFGFPGFITRTGAMTWSVKTLKFQVVDCARNIMQLSGFYFILSQKQHRSVLSLKAPRKWLYSFKDTIPKVCLKKPYDLCPSFLERYFSKPDQISSFAFSWQANKSSRLRIFIPFQFQKEKEPAILHTSFKQSITADNIKYLIRNDYPATIAWSNIRRMLVKSSAQECRKEKDKQIEAKFTNTPATKKLIGNYKKFLFPKTSFIGPDILMKPICSSILGFFQKFPEITAAENKGMFSYKSRLRQYFFPYKPSYDYMTLGKSDFFCIDDTTSIQSFEDIAELKTSQIFETATFKIGLKPFFKCIFSSTIPQKLPEQSHHLKIKTTFPYKIASPQKITREIKSCRRFIPQTGSDAKTMLKNYLSYTCSAKISRMVKSFSKTDFLPGFESSNYVPDYSFSGNFTIESVHWIILLSGFLKLGMQQPDYFSKNILNIKGKQSAFDFTTDFAVQKTFIPLFESPKDKLEQLQSPDFFASSNISQSFERKQNNLTGDFRIESYVYQKDYYPVFIKTDSRKEFDFSADAFLSPLTKICDSTPINAKPYAFDPNKISCKQYKSAPACVAPELKPILKHHNLRPLKTEFKHVSFPDWVDIDFATNISDMNCMQ